MGQMIMTHSPIWMGLTQMVMGLMQNRPLVCGIFPKHLKNRDFQLAQEKGDTFFGLEFQ